MRGFRLLANDGQPRPKVLPFPKKGIAQTQPSASIIDVSASSGGGLPQPLSESALREAVSRIVHHGDFRESWHAANDRSYRNVSHDDMVYMLERSWALASRPEWDDRHHNWKYKLSGHDIEGDELTLIVAVNTEEQMITIITKY